MTARDPTPRRSAAEIGSRPGSEARAPRLLPLALLSALACDGPASELRDSVPEPPPAVAEPFPPSVTTVPGPERPPIRPFVPSAPREDVGFGPVALGASASIGLALEGPLHAAPPPCPARPFCWDGASVHFAPTEVGSATTTFEAGSRRVHVHGFGQGRPLACFDLGHALRRMAFAGCIDADVVCVHPGMGPAPTVPLEASAVGDAVSVEAREHLEAVGARSILRLRVCPRATGPFELRFATPEGTAPAASGSVAGHVGLARVASGDPARLPVGLRSELELILEDVHPDVLPALTARPRAHASLQVARAEVDARPSGSARVKVEVIPLAATSGPDALEVEVGYGDFPPSVFRIAFEAFGSSCQIEVEPASVDFGALPLSLRPLPLAVHLTQRGPRPCPVRLPATPGAGLAYGPGFSPEGLQPIGPGETASVPLLPRGGLSAEIRQSTFRFEITGASGPEAVRVPTRVELRDTVLGFQSVGGRCAYDWPRTFELAGHPGAATRVERLEIVGDPGFALVGPAAPFTLEAGGTAEVRVAFDGRAPRARTELRLEARTRGFTDAARIPLDYHGLETLERAVDRFETLGRRKVDHLFVLDGSGSFERTGSLRANLHAFWQFLQAQGYSAQLAFLRADHADPAELGAISTGVLRSGIEGVATDGESAFLAAAEATLAGPSGQREQPLAAVLAAVGGATWLRSDAVLSVIVVSDEDDQSPVTLNEALSALLLVKGVRNTNLFVVNAISGGSSGCRERGLTADPSPRLVELAERTGGVFQAVCTSDWSRSLEDLSTTAFGYKSRFSLTRQPLEETLEVWVEGERLPRSASDGIPNWTYDFATNSINFSPFALPGPGITFEVRYALECR